MYVNGQTIHLSQILCDTKCIIERVLNSCICQHCDIKTSTVAPTFYYFLIIFLTCYISVPSFIYKPCQAFLLRNHLKPQRGLERTCKLQLYILSVYDGAIYEQQDGAAMRSPVSTVIANLYSEDSEEQALSSLPTAPKIWKCFVDDTFTILKWNDVEDFLEHLNTQQPTIHFTMETERDNTIPFSWHFGHKGFRRLPHYNC